MSTLRHNSSFSQGSPDEIQDFLPIELNTMKNSAEDCLKYAKETEAAFDQVISGGSRFSQKGKGQTIYCELSRGTK